MTIGATPLHSAAEKGHEKIVEILIKNKASLHDKDVFGKDYYLLNQFLCQMYL